LTQATAISVGGGSACALLSGGSVLCWGANGTGQLGNSATTGPEPTPIAVSGLTGATAVSVGDGTACSLFSGGTVRCWGYNEYGQLGDGTTTNSSTPVAVSGLAGATAVSVGDSNGCALLSGGTVQCWGYNAYGQLGVGTIYGPDTSCYEETCSTTPVAVDEPTDGGLTGAELTGAVAVSVGTDVACALMSGGTVECWGYNLSGELGNGTTTNASTPVAVTGLTGATAISVGGNSACALLSGGTVECWGDNSYAELGNGARSGPETCYAGQSCSTIPVAVSGLVGATAVSVGIDSACALLSGGTVECWGDNGAGELGNGTTTGPDICCLESETDGGCRSATACSTTPVAVTGLAGATTVSVGSYSVCALLSGGSVQCWGLNAVGQLGNGTTTGQANCNAGPGPPVPCWATPVMVQ